MPTPFLKKHSEEQYLNLEKNYLNLFNFLQSLLSITEGEDLSSDSQKLNHFDALCMRVNQTVEEYSNFANEVRGVMFKGDSATTTSYPEPVGNVLITVNTKEYKLLIEACEHMGFSFPNLKVSDEFHALAEDLKNITKESEHEPS